MRPSSDVWSDFPASFGKTVFKDRTYAPSIERPWYEDFTISLNSDVDKAIDAARLKGWCYCQIEIEGECWTFIKEGVSCNIFIWRDAQGFDKWEDTPIKSYWQSNAKNTQWADSYQQQFLQFCKSCFET